MTFRTTTEKIVMDIYQQSNNSNPEVEKIRIIKAASDLLRNDIRQVQCKSDQYNIFDAISSKEEALDFIPVSSQLFLGSLFLSKAAKRKFPLSDMHLRRLRSKGHKSSTAGFFF